MDELIHDIGVALHVNDNEAHRLAKLLFEKQATTREAVEAICEDEGIEISATEAEFLAVAVEATLAA